MEYSTGYKGTNKQGLAFEVTNYVKAKEIHVTFEIENATVCTTRQYISKGLPMHPTFGKPKIGDVFKDSSGNLLKLVSKDVNKVGNWLIEWLEDGATASRRFDDIRNSGVKHPTKGIIKQGDFFTPNNGLTFEVLRYNSSTDIDIKFLDGSLQKTTAADIRKGVVGHPTSGLTTGQEFTTRSGWVGTIIYYNSCYDVGVKWQDGSTSSHPASHIKDRAIKPAFQPSVCGVGYFGSGRFVNNMILVGEKAPEVVYQYWQRMIVRCFDPKELLKPTGTTYLNVEVCKNWFNFHNFAEWALSQPNWNIGNELDKDLLGTGFEYSPENCTFLPAEVNIFLSDQYAREVHDLPKGVQYLKPGSSGAKVGYVARCHTDKGREYLGYFDCPKEAHRTYKKTKEDYAKVLAERHKSKMTKQAYEKLLAFEVTM